MNHKKFRRLYHEERLQVRRRGDRKRALGTRAPMTVPHGPNQRWSLDLVSDAFACGRRFRIFAVVDDYSRECVRLIACQRAPKFPQMWALKIPYVGGLVRSVINRNQDRDFLSLAAARGALLVVD